MRFGVVKRRVLAHAHQCGRLLNIQFRVDTNSMVNKVIFVQIQSKNLLLCIIALQFYGNDPFGGLLECPLDRTAGHMFGIQLFGQLLSDSTAAAGTVLLKYHALDYCPYQRLKVYSGMLLETDILGCHKSLDQVR